jgi:hypothetical protein
MRLKGLTVGAIGVAVLLGAAIAVVMQTGRPTLPSRSGRGPFLKTERNMPLALSRHMERLSQTIPGHGGESEGPGSGEAEKFLALAYPDTDVPLARLTTARSAAGNLKKKGFPHGKGRKGT